MGEGVTALAEITELVAELMENEKLRATALAPRFWRYVKVWLAAVSASASDGQAS